MIAAGPNAVAEAFAAEAQILRLFVEPECERRCQPLLRAAASRGIPVSKVGKDECDRIAGIRCQGIAAEIVLAYADLGEVLEAIDNGIVSRGREQGQGALLVFLDGVQDPHNLGAVIRTAEAAGAAAVVVPNRRAAPVSPTVMRISAGAAAHLPVCRVVNLGRALAAARDRGFWAIGLDHEADRMLDCPKNPAAKVALVLGGEAEGLHRLVREGCDEIARLPMAGRVESLNASVAASIAIYKVSERRLSVDRVGSR